MVEKFVPGTYIKNQNWAYLRINSLKCYKLCICCMSKSRFTITLKLTCSFAFTFLKLFKKTKTGLELVSLPHFLHGFWRKVFLTLYFINWWNFIAWLPLLLEILGDMSIVTICCPICGVINFEINRSFFIKPSFYITKKSGQKCKHLKNKKSFKHEIKNIFHHF